MNRILFVDDEPAIPRSLQRIVRSYSLGAETETAGSAQEALECVARGDIDVVVSDVHMPGMDGIELLTRLKADPSTQHIPVIMLTGDGDVTVKNVALELGAAEFVNKPADATELCARLRNVMRLKSYQDQLVRQNDILTAQIIQAQKMEIAGLLASGVAHDLNNILTAIVGNAELMIYKIKDTDLHPDLQKVITAAQHAARLVREIRDLGRRSSSDVTACNPSEVIDESLELLRVIIPEGITVQWSRAATDSPVDIENTALHQIVMNLVINAVHAMGKEGTLSLNVSETELDLEEAAKAEVSPGRFTVISVSDTGHGIDETALPHIFEPFFTTKDQGKGTGIGLSVVDRLVRGKNGFVKVTSAAGQGAVFAVHFPIHENVASQTPAAGANTAAG